MSEPFLNIAQEIFLVLFSILYGVMLQSLIGLQAFPLGRLRRGLVNRQGRLELFGENLEEYRKTYEKKMIRKKKGKTFDKWLVSIWRKRFALSLGLLNFLPLVYAWGILNLLNKISISSQFLFYPDFFNFILVFGSALGVFGFYRLYHAFITCNWKSLFSDITKQLEERGTSFDALVNVICGFVYYLPAIILLIGVICFGR